MKHLLFSLLALLPLVAFAGPPPPAPDSGQVSGAQPRWSGNHLLTDEPEGIVRYISPKSIRNRYFCTIADAALGTSGDAFSGAVCLWRHKLGKNRYWSIKRVADSVSGHWQVNLFKRLPRSMFAWRPSFSRLQSGLGLRLMTIGHLGVPYYATHQQDADLLFHSSRVTTANVALNIRYTLNNWRRIFHARHTLTLGWALDLGGITMGGRRPAHLDDGGANGNASPQRGNLLFGKCHGFGTRYQEFYLDYRISARITARGGLARTVSHYVFEQQRYYRADNLAFLGISYGLGGTYRQY